MRDAPSAVAAVHRGTRWTHADLDAAANRVAGTLLAAGLRPEGVVAVISRRTLDWLAAILGIFKAGGVYLPIDPAYPDKRITSAHAVAIRHSVALGRPLDEIGRNEDFFAHGGNSLPGVRLVVLLGGLVSLLSLIANPVLADLAAAADRADAGDSPLLQALSVPENPAVALVCVPYEAGNALNFGAMAQALSTSDVAVIAGSAGISAWLRDYGAIVDMDQWRSVRGELIERAYRHDLGEAERYLGACTETVDLPATIIAVPRALGEGDAAARCAAVFPAARTVRFAGAGRYLLRSHAAAAADLVSATIAATGGGFR